MKKTLIALAVTAMAATSANAAVIYQHEGTKINLDGRAALEIVSLKDKRTDLVDRGSRVRVQALQEIGGGFSALANAELRFSSGNNVGGSARAHRLYGGFTNKDIGTLTFGRQLTLGDHIPKANYTWEMGGNVLHDSHGKAAHFMSASFGGVRLAADYYFGTADKASENDGQGFGVGFFYDGKWDKLAFRLGSGYVEQEVGTAAAENRKKKMAGVGFDIKYDLFTIGLDWAHGKSDKQYADYGFHHVAARYSKIDRFELGVKFDVTQSNALYGEFLWGTGKINDTEGKHRGWFVGVDHKFNKNVIVYLEGGKSRVKESGATVQEERRIGLGTRIMF